MGRRRRPTARSATATPKRRRDIVQCAAIDSDDLRQRAIGVDLTNSPKTSLLGDTALTFGRHVLSGLFNLAFIVLVARYLGVEANGQVVMAILVTTVLFRLLEFGTTLSNVYHISQGKLSTSICLKFSGIAALVSTTCAALIFTVLTMTSDWGILSDVNMKFVQISILFYPFLIASAYIASIFRGVYKIRTYNALILLPTASTLIFSIILLALFKFAIWTAIVAWGLGHAMACALGIVLLIFLPADGAEQSSFSRSTFGTWLYYSVRSYPFQVFHFLILRADAFMVNFFLGSTIAGIYVIATQICERIMMVPQSLGIVLFPRLGRLRDSLGDQGAYTRTLTSGVFYFTASVGFFIFLISDPVIDVLFGKDFNPAVEVIWLLLPGIIAYSGASVLGTYINASGRPGINSWRGGASFVLNVVLNLSLIPTLGIVGAAIATSISYVASFVMALVYFQRLSGLGAWSVLAVDRDLQAICVGLLKRLARR